MITFVLHSSIKHISAISFEALVVHTCLIIEISYSMLCIRTYIQQSSLVHDSLIIHVVQACAVIQDSIVVVLLATFRTINLHKIKANVLLYPWIAHVIGSLQTSGTDGPCRLKVGGRHCGCLPRSRPLKESISRSLRLLLLFISK